MAMVPSILLGIALLIGSSGVRWSLRPRSVDISQDKTGFFEDVNKRLVVMQAANDWAYFFDRTHLDAFASGEGFTRQFRIMIAPAKPRAAGRDSV
jgi:hypothetical protein